MRSPIRNCKTKDQQVLTLKKSNRELAMRNLIGVNKWKDQRRVGKTNVQQVLEVVLRKSRRIRYLVTEIV